MLPPGLSKCLTSFQVSCCKGKCKQSMFPRRPVSQPSICVLFQTFLLLPDLFHIKRAVSLDHRNRLRKSEWCLSNWVFFFFYCCGGLFKRMVFPVWPGATFGTWPLGSFWPYLPFIARTSVSKVWAVPAHLHEKWIVRGCGRPYFYIIHQLYLFLPSDGLATGPFFFHENKWACMWPLFCCKETDGGRQSFLGCSG